MPTGPESFEFLNQPRDPAAAGDSIPTGGSDRTAAAEVADSAGAEPANAPPEVVATNTSPANDRSAGELARLGHYRILELLGRGGMGQVFRAEDTRLKRQVALKVMNKRFSATPNSRRRFLEEARAMAAIDDDNVVTIYEVGESGGTPFMAMELLRGSTLESITKSGKPLASDELIGLAQQLISGLAAAHRRGIVHRDVKPGNVWIEEPSGRVKVLDFGLALASSPVDALADRGSVIGTPGYLSPEQARGERLDDRSDLFSAGVVLYELACGHAPFSAQTVPEQLIKILSCQPPRPDRVNPLCPSPLADVIMRLLAKEPRERYRSAQESVTALTRAAQTIEAEKHAAVQIVLEAPAPSTRTTGKASTTPLAPAASLASDVRLWAALATGLVVIIGLAYWGLQAKDKAPPTVPAVPSGPAEAVVLASTLDVLQLREFLAAPSAVFGGQQARFRLVLANAATSDQDDPRRLNPGVRAIAQVATLLYPAQPADQGTRGTPQSVAFPRKLSAAMIPAPGKQRELDLDFPSLGIPPGDYEVVFELQSPQGTRINRLATPLTVEENLAASDLVGFDRVRTSRGNGADTFVKAEAKDEFGGRPSIDIDRLTAADKTVEVTHAYLRFDLREWADRKSKIDRAVLLMTLEPGGFQGKCKLEAYGVTTRLPQDWREKGENHLTWETSPSVDKVENYPFLGRIEFDNSGGQLEKRPDELRLFGPGLDDYLRDSTESTVTLLLVRSNDAKQATKLVSREGNENEAPALAIRERR